MKNPTIYILDNNFQVLDVIDEYSSLQITRILQKPHDFEIHMPYRKTISPNSFFYLPGCKYSGIITEIEIKTENNEGVLEENLILKGYSPLMALYRRIIIPPSGSVFDSASGNAETVIKHFITSQCINPEDPNRAIPNLKIASDMGRGGNIDMSLRYTNLGKELEKIIISQGWGWDIVFNPDEKLFTFDIIEGSDKTANSDNPVIFSRDFDNVENEDYILSVVNTKNALYVGGYGEGSTRPIVSVGDSTGWQRIEEFVDASNTDETLLNDYANTLLSKMGAITQSYNANVINNVFKYRENWDLGDIVTIKNKDWGVMINAQITQIKEIYEDEFKLEVTFGSPPPTFTEALANKLISYDNAVAK